MTASLIRFTPPEMPNFKNRRLSEPSRCGAIPSRWALFKIIGSGQKNPQDVAFARTEFLVRMFEQALKSANGLSPERRHELMTRLDCVRVISHKVGYGVGDDMDFLMSKFTPKRL